MNDELLLIDNEVVDIDDSTNITLDIKSNLFSDVSKIASNTTYTIRLPKTERNQRILEHTDLVQSSNTYPYLKHTVRYFHNGVEIIKDGILAITAVTDEAFEVSVLWGVYKKLKDLVTKGTTIDQLNTTDKILYNQYNQPATYADAQNADYFYPYYIPYYSKAVDNILWKYGDYMLSPNSSRADNQNEESTFIGSRSLDGNKGGNVSYQHLHPVVKATYVMRLIKEQTGINFIFNDTGANELISKLIIPLISKKANELTFTDKLKANIMPEVINSNRYAEAKVSFFITDTTNGFTNKIETTDELVVKSDSKIYLDILVDWSFKLNAKPSGWGTKGYLYNLSGKPFFNVTVIHPIVDGEQADNDTYIIGDDTGRGSMWFDTEYNGDVIMSSYGSGSIDVVAGDKITITAIHLGSLNITGGYIHASITSDGDVPFGGYYPITSNLPKIKIIDFIKFLSAITGTFPKQFTNDGIVEFLPLKTVFNNKENALDWTYKVITQKTIGKPYKLSFSVNSYAQNNYYRWKEDEAVRGNYDGNLRTNNETLDIEKKLIDFPFAASDGTVIPMYEVEYNEEEKDGKKTTVVEYNYKACKDRILKYRGNSKGIAEAYFDMNMQDIINSKYTNITDALRMAKVVNEKIRINDIELSKFDETIPVYLGQYSAFFAVLEIKQSSTGVADVTLLKLN